MRSQRGATLVEMLVAMAMPALIAGGANGAARIPTSNTDGTIDQIIARAMAARPGCTVTTASMSESQPSAVYASTFSFSFVTECLSASPTPRDRFASSPYTAAGTLPVWTAAWGGSTGGSTVASPANVVDTVTFFFQPDNATPRTDDFVFMRQLNTQRPEVVVRNVLTYPGRPFFQYWYRTLADKGRTATLPVPGSWLPLWHLHLEHGAVADTGTAARIDMLRAIEVNYRVTNGKTGVDERARPVVTIIPLASLTAKHRPPCGYDPLFTQASSVEAEPDPVSEIAQLFMGGLGMEGRGTSRTQCGMM